MKFRDFINTLTVQEVNEFWDSIETVPAEALSKNWKYSLKRGDKIVPTKWFITELSLKKNEQIDFQSNYDNRDIFAEKFGFKIHEDLVFDMSDLQRFKKFYETQVKNKSLFQFFIDHTHNTLEGNNIDPYKIRMAITQQNEAIVIVGMRTVLQYKNDRIGFIIKSEHYDEIVQLYNVEKSYDFKGSDDVYFVHSHPDFIPDSTADKILEVNADTILYEYKKIENSIRSRWNAEANSTNHTLKKIMFENDNVEGFLKSNKEFKMEYFDVEGILKYRELTKGQYDKNSEATKIFNDTRTKINYLAELLSGKLGIKLQNNYNERINKQAGKQTGHHNYKDYILVGFIPTHLNKFGKDIFIKIAFGFSETIPNLHYQIDINYKNNSNPFAKGRDYLLKQNDFWIDLDDHFPKTWNELLTNTTDNFRKIIKSLEDFLNNNKVEETPKTAHMSTKYHPLNQILFGCPGSGKTYSTKKLAVEIIEDRKFTNTKEDRAEIIKLYDQYTEKNQIKFTTFHQSLSYEDFIEGIKPKTVNNQVIYEIENGLFNKISQKAQDNWLNSQTKENNELSFEDALSKLQDEWVEDNDIKFPLKTKGNDFTITGFNEKNLNFRKASGGTAHTLSFNTMKELYYGKRNFTNAGVGIYYPAIIERLRSYEGDSKPSKKLDNYVLIMDEINRGNISSIFGELITLIEEDKRLGSTEKIEVNLPYSKESFGVPPNLYLIGTMNTADRSVESLDTALRRRFSFTEMKSDPEVIRTAHENRGIIQDSLNINLIELLDTINKRIELLVDKDHQIGHSYFIGVNTLSDLKVTFKNKIIPLLEEYFFGDFGKIGLVLGDQFVETNSAQDNKKILSKFKGYEDVDFLTDKKIYTFKDVDQMTANDFASIYNDYNDQSN